MKAGARLVKDIYIMKKVFGLRLRLTVSSGLSPVSIYITYFSSLKNNHPYNMYRVISKLYAFLGCANLAASWGRKFCYWSFLVVI